MNYHLGVVLLQRDDEAVGVFERVVDLTGESEYADLATRYLDAITFGMRMNFTDNTASYGYYRYARDIFADKGFDPMFSSRDADYHLLGLRHTWFFADRRGQVSIGIEYERNDDAGVNFEMDGLIGRLSAIFSLSTKTRVDIEISYSEDEYDRFSGSVPQETDRTGISIGLSRWFASHLEVRLDFSYCEEDSTYDVLNYDRTVWGASINYVFQALPTPCSLRVAACRACSRRHGVWTVDGAAGFVAGRSGHRSIPRCPALRP